MTIRISIAGAGLVGQRHAEAIRQAGEVILAGISDPSPTAQDFAKKVGVPWYATLEQLITVDCSDGIILSVPNAVHAEAALTCISAGIPALVEKPFTPDTLSGEAVRAAAEAAGVPLLIGHHRRHNSLIREALEVVHSGALGTLTAVQAQTWFLKPDHYFESTWRTQKGAGPVFLNLIHDIDLLHAFCGPVESVHAMESNFLRGHEVEETAVILLRFQSGLLGTMNVSDAAAAPWSWELTARENAQYPATSENCYWIAGTKGSVALPNLAVWRHAGNNGWWDPIGFTKPIFGFEDPLVKQIEHFARVIQRKEQPLVSAADGLAAVKVVEAIKRSASSGQTIMVES